MRVGCASYVPSGTVRGRDCSKGGRGRGEGGREVVPECCVGLRQDLVAGVCPARDVVG